VEYRDRSVGKTREEIKALIMKELAASDDFVVLCANTSSDRIHATAVWSIGDTRTAVQDMSSMIVQLLDEEGEHIKHTRRTVIDPSLN